MTLRFSVNISMLFTELPYLDRPAAVADHGFGAIETWWPFATAVPDRDDVDAFVHAVIDAGVRLDAMNFFAGTLADGDRGVLSLPRRSAEFRSSVDVLIDIARRTGCRRFNALYGVRVEDSTPAEQDALATENLGRAADAVRAVEGIVLVEPLARGENGAYPLATTDDVLQVLARVGVDNIAMLADFYHLDRNGVPWLSVVEQDFERVGHVQIADSPGRHQPGTGQLDFPSLFAALDAAHYATCIGLEYRPDGGSAASLDWLPLNARSDEGGTP